MDSAMELRDEKVRALIASATKLPGDALQRVRDRVDDMLLHIQKRAQERAPSERGTLRRSAKTETRAVTGQGLAAEISFGGMASAYAEVQHENEDYTHTRAEWAAKYGYSKGLRSSLKTGHVSVMKQRGKGALKLRGHKGGQAHFLYGDEGSAYNAAEQRMVTTQIERAILAEAEKL